MSLDKLGQLHDEPGGLGGGRAGLVIVELGVGSCNGRINPVNRILDDCLHLFLTNGLDYVAQVLKGLDLGQVRHDPLQVVVVIAWNV